MEIMGIGMMGVEDRDREGMSGLKRWMGGNEREWEIGAAVGCNELDGQDGGRGCVIDRHGVACTVPYWCIVEGSKGGSNGMGCCVGMGHAGCGGTRVI